MLVKDKKRIEFERLLRKLGYRDRSPILPQDEKRIKEQQYICSTGAIMISTFIIIIIIIVGDEQTGVMNNV